MISFKIIKRFEVGWMIFCILAFVMQSARCYKPVILVHGVNADGGALSDLENYIKEASPGTNVTSLDIYDNLLSFVPLDKQLPYFIEKVRAIMEQAPDGVHLICHSQGGLVCRGIIEMMSDHNVDTVITLSSPLLGQFGIPPSWEKYLPLLQNKTRDEVTKLVYTTIFQDIMSVANYWRDPRPEYFKEFEEICRFLPLLDNNPKAANYDPKVAMSQKKSFLKIQRFVALGGPDDGVINPWQSSIFAYLDEDAENIVPMEKQIAYIEDWFGLRSLNERGGVIRYPVPGIHHQGWHRSKIIFEKYVNKWLR
ncbi:lysosomal thioesterase PPT2-B-like [Rhopilema esculentum]|uniref:lysosomal thioesterase PPT2-B-like n=1 Tax=Rhopilema esculentum TaxID=499914 RepID=UPI0031E356F8